MSRLTFRDSKGEAWIKEAAHIDEQGQICMLADRLAAYEDTGLTPDEVALYVKCEAQRVSKRELELATDNERLRAQLEQAEDNTPLTLDELRQMDGEPVYIVCGDRRDELNGWFIVYAAEQKIELPCGPETIQTVTLYNAEDELNPEVAFYGMTCAGHGNLCKNDCQHGLHQLGWLAYRSKPKEEA